MEAHANEPNTVHFTPMLYTKDVAAAMEFYKNAFNARELRRWSNDDGSVHVAEMSIEKALFRLHEEVPRKTELSPQTLKGTTVVTGLFVSDPDAVTAKAIVAGAEETSPVQDYDYGYRQAGITDPFGHHWVIEKRMTELLSLLSYQSFRIAEE